MYTYLTDMQTTANYSSLKHISWELHSLRHGRHVVDGKLSILQPQRNSWRERERGGGERKEGGREERQEGGKEGGREEGREG